MDGKLPNHVPINISQKDIPKFKEYLILENYRWVFLQVVKPKQIVGRVTDLSRNGIQIEHHVRVFTDGTITSEYELPRVDQMWLHLTTVSYSAHERIIDMLEEIGIDYQLDEKLRLRYNTEAVDNYPRRYMEFLDWLLIGVIFWSPLGYIWKFYYKMKNKILEKISIDKKKISLPDHERIVTR